MAYHHRDLSLHGHHRLPHRPYNRGGSRGGSDRGARVEANGSDWVHFRGLGLAQGLMPPFPSTVWLYLTAHADALSVAP
jgi:hypothetical protein